jgi:crossover junction endodeoxyribonuclease RuvC
VVTVIIGIDPGITGAIACLVDGELLDVEDMPTFTEMRGKRNVTTVSPSGVTNVLDEFAVNGVNEPLVIIERVHATPQMGVTSAFNFGDGYGVLRGCVAALGYPVRYVEPSVWKKAAGLTADKGGSRRLASERWPAVAQLFARVKDDGRAEAALIAAWGAGNT